MVFRLKFNISHIFQYSLFFILAILIFGSTYVGYILNKSKEYAEIVNLSGKIRGDIQRFTKLYFAGEREKCRQLKVEIDRFFYLLGQKVDNLELPFMETDIELYPVKVKECWNKLSTEVLNNPSNKGEILKISEECWERANKQTDLYQKKAQENMHTLEMLYYTLIILGASVNLLLLYMVVIKKTFRKLEFKAHFDALTGIYNRAALYEMFPLLSKNSYFHPLSLIMFDIDNFKRINDTYGHNVGDIVLKTLAEEVKKHLRRSDIFVRWGGEEFIVLLPQTDIEGAYKVAEKLRKAIENLKIPELGGKRVTASFGVTAVRPGEKLEEAVLRADISLYEAKRKGKNRVEVFV